METKELIAEFIEHKGAPELHGGDPWTNALARVHKKHENPPSDRIKKITTQFRQLMQLFLNQHADSETKNSFDVRATWEDIQKEAQEAIEKHKSDGKSWKHPVAKITKKYEWIACRIEFLFELLPDGEYTGILKGGLKLMYNAAKRMKYIRELVLRTFDSLGETIENTHSYIHVYIHDTQLQLKAEDLYVAVLEAVSSIVGWLKNKTAKENVKAFFNPGLYQQELADRITTSVQDKALAFDARVRACLHSSVHDIKDHVIKVRGDVNHLSEEFRSGLDDMKENLEETVAEMKQQFEIKSALENVLLELVKNRDWMISGVKEVQYLKEILQDRVEQINHQQPVVTQPALIQIIPTYIFSLTITIHQLLDMLESPSEDQLQTQRRYILDTVFQNDQYILSQGNALSTCHQELLTITMQHAKFQSWFQSRHSGTLTVTSLSHTAMSSAHYHEAAVSPVSYMCRLLSLAVSQSGLPTPLAFYCTEHCTGDLEGPSGLVRSLVAQLLTRWGAFVDLGFIAHLEDVQKIEEHDIKTLCQLFWELLESIAIRTSQIEGGAVVICLVDGVSCFETKSRRVEMEFVMRFLDELMTNIAKNGSTLVFKLLVTSHGSSQGLKEWFPNAESIFLSDEHYADGQGTGGY